MLRLIQNVTKQTEYWLKERRENNCLDWRWAARTDCNLLALSRSTIAMSNRYEQSIWAICRRKVHIGPLRRAASEIASPSSALNLQQVTIFDSDLCLAGWCSFHLPILKLLGLFVFSSFSFQPDLARVEASVRLTRRIPPITPADVTDEGSKSSAKSSENDTTRPKNDLRMIQCVKDTNHKNKIIEAHSPLWRDVFCSTRTCWDLTGEELVWRSLA